MSRKIDALQSITYSRLLDLLLLECAGVTAMETFAEASGSVEIAAGVLLAEAASSDYARGRANDGEWKLMSENLRTSGEKRRNTPRREGVVGKMRSAERVEGRKPAQPSIP
jgi:hypothetical protein